MLRQDYILRMIAQLTDSISAALNKSQLGLSQDAITGLEEGVGLALEMSPETVFSLAPESISTILSISNVDESVAVYVVYAIKRIVAIYEEEGDPRAELRAAQAQAIADFYGFPVESTPDL